MLIPKNQQSPCPELAEWSKRTAVDIDAIIKERTARAAQARAFDFEGRTIKDVGAPSKDELASNVDNINIRETGGGTSADYLTARIARDHPEILDRMTSCPSCTLVRGRIPIRRDGPGPSHRPSCG